MVTAKPTPLDTQQIMAANADLQDRLFNEGVHLVYDEDGDTLLIAIGEGKLAITKSSVGGVYLRVEPETFKILGCTILAFASDFLAKNKLMRKAFPDALTAMKASDGKIDLVGKDAQKAKALFEIVLNAS